MSLTVDQSALTGSSSATAITLPSASGTLALTSQILGGLRVITFSGSTQGTSNYLGLVLGELDAGGFSIVGETHATWILNFPNTTATYRHTYKLVASSVNMGTTLTTTLANTAGATSFIGVPSITTVNGTLFGKRLHQHGCWHGHYAGQSLQLFWLDQHHTPHGLNNALGLTRVP